MKDSKSRKNFLGYIGITLALALIVTGTTALIRVNGTADAEAVTISENATVVTSPFTEAVQKVHGSVVGVNNYTNYTNRSNRYGSYFGFGYGYGYGNGAEEEEPETRQVLQGSGSGVVVADGYVLTNFHVVENAAMVEIVSGEETYTATVAGYDETRDLAVLKVDDLDIEPVVLGDSDVLQVGDWAICIGNPLSFTGTTTVGVISALNREIATSATDAYGRRTNEVNLMIQTDAAINSGNSGGGMFNVAGELIGVPSMKYTGSYYSSAQVDGIGMAIPINVAKPLIQQVLSGETVANAAEDNAQSGISGSGAITGPTPRIGVSVYTINASNNYAVSGGYLPTGALISIIESGSPAEKSGLQVNDIIVEVDGTIVTSSTEATDMIKAKKAGETVALKVFRAEGNLAEIQDYTKIEGDYVDVTVELAMLDTAQP